MQTSAQSTTVGVNTSVRTSSEVTSAAVVRDISLLSTAKTASVRKIYTVGHKKGATFIFTITLANMDRFQ